MQLIAYNKENHPILNKIYDILAELLTQEKQIILCKVPAKILIKIHKEADKAANKAINMSGMTKIRHTRPSGRQETLSGKGVK